VEPAAEEGPNRDVGNQVQPDSLRELGPDGLLPLVSAWSRIRFQAKLPVAARRTAKVLGGYDQDVRRRQFLDVLKNGPLAADHAEGEIILQGGNVNLPSNAGVREERLQLGPEDKLLAVAVEVERLDAEAVAGEKQPAPLTVPKGEGEHA